MSVATAEEFLNVLNRSGLLEKNQLRGVEDFIARPGKPSAVKVAQWLVKSEMVTVWQAERLLAGDSKFILVGKYKFIDSFAEGAMGEVFKAKHLIMGRTVAVKVLSKARLSHPNALARFTREIQAVAALDHPNIVTAFDAGQVGRTHYLVMEYIDGRDLNAWQEKYGKLPVPWACEFIRQAAHGLHHAHRQGLVHRDIKPANLLVAWNDDENRPVVKVLDLGLARATDPVDDELDAGSSDDTSFTLSSTPSHLTQAGAILGTPDYLAPEQIIRNHDVDARTDIFGLGCTLFKLLTGELPFGGTDLMAKLAARVSPSAPPPVRLRSLRPEAPELLEAILAKMLARNPDRRFNSAEEVASALERFARPPKEKWNELRPPQLPERDSSEVGSSQMEADPRLREFFAGLEVEDSNIKRMYGAAGDEAGFDVGGAATNGRPGGATASDKHEATVEIAALPSANFQFMPRPPGYPLSFWMWLAAGTLALIIIAAIVVGLSN